MTGPAQLAHEGKGLEPTVLRYLKEVKKWHESDFRLEWQGSSDDHRCAIVAAIYCADEINPVPGQGQSVELHVDRQQRSVVREFHFQ